MKTFKQFIALYEKMNPDNYVDRVSGKTASLFLGRMQPIHNGHDAIIKMMKNPIVVLVKGAKSSADKERNPFDAKYQTKLIKMLNPGITVSEQGSGYLPDIIDYFRRKGVEINEVLAGDDRIGGYERQIGSFNKQVPGEKQVKVKFTKTPRVTSASKVRALIRADDFEGFKKEVPQKLWKEYDTMKKKLGVK